MLRNEIRINEEYAKMVMFDENKKPDEENDEIIRNKMMRHHIFFNRLNALNQDYPILPINCRYYKQISHDSKVMIIEEPPRIRTLMFNIEFERYIEQLKIGGKLKEYGFENFLETKQRPYKLRLSLPYVIFIFFIDGSNIGEVKAFFRLSPITGFHDYLLRPNLFNISPSYEICVGPSYDRTATSINGKISDYINLFWSNSFNTDYHEHCNDYRKVLGVDNPLTWAYNTKVDPMFIFNVEWLNIKNNLNSIITNYIDNSRSGYKNILSVFNDSNNMTVPNDSDKLKFTNICESHHMLNKIVSVGDSLKIKNKELYVEEFFKYNTSNIVYISLEDENEKSRIYKLTQRFREFIEKLMVKDTGIESVVIFDGVIVKKKDILIFGDNLYKEVLNIRKSLDGNIELLLGGNYHLAKNCKAQVADMSNFKLGDTTLKTDAIYYIFSSNGHLKYFNYVKTKFKRITVGNSGRIRCLFLDKNDNEHSISTTEHEYYKIIEESNLEQLPIVFRIFKKIMFNMKAYKTNNEIILEGTVENITDDIFRKACLTRDSFHIKSFDIDIELKIGDKVVIPNWDNPASMLLIKTITGFILDDGKLSVAVTDSNNSTEFIEYVHIGRNHINTGAIRKISTSFDKIRSGMKIIAKEKGISNFPKKDVNIIIGFITDTGTEPLVLCSNCCTLWLSDLIENFELIPRSSLRWKKLDHSEIHIDRIKPQIGDLFTNSYNETCLIHGQSGTNALYYVSIRNLEQNEYYKDSYNFKSRIINNFYGILNPRTHLSKEKELHGGISNMHNNFTKTNSNGLKFNFGDNENV